MLEPRLRPSLSEERTRAADAREERTSASPEPVDQNTDPLRYAPRHDPEDILMRCLREAYDQDNKHHLRDDPPYDLSPYGPFRVHPSVKTLQAAQRLARKMRMHELERIREDGTTGAEHNRTDARRRGKQQSAPDKAQQRITADRDRI